MSGMSGMSDFCENDYTNLYLTQLFKTLGQLSAALLTTTLAVPVYSFYSRYYRENKVFEMFKDKYSESDNQSSTSTLHGNNIEDSVEDNEDNESTDLDSFSVNKNN
jgi:hypothetical protein